MIQPAVPKVATLWVKGKIKSDTFTEFVNALDACGYCEVIEVNIHTPGGILYVGKTIMEYLEMKKRQGILIKTIAWGQCASAGTLIQLSADAEYREISPSCAYCIHEVMNGGDLYGARAKELIELGQDIENDNQQLAILYAQRTGNTVEQIRAWMFEDINWDSKTAIERGFASKMTPNVLNEALEVVDKVNEYDPKSPIFAKDMKYKKYMSQSLGFERANMPQIDLEMQDLFFAYFVMKYGQEYVLEGEIYPEHLRPSQLEIDEIKVLEKLEAKSFLNRVFVVSKDFYLIDGHHDWAASLEEANTIAFGKRAQPPLKCVKIELPAKNLIKEANKLKGIYNDRQNLSKEELIFKLLLEHEV